MPQNKTRSTKQNSCYNLAMKKYKCTVCGHIYDPAENNNISFADLPADWKCPVCGVGKDKFVPLD